MGPTDIASHARHGLESRAAPMFGEPGHAYVYFTYGMHYCMNCVTEPAGSGTAVLIRAVEPEEGVALMRRNRKRRSVHLKELSDHDLTNGPAKLCQALAIDRQTNTADLLGSEIWIEADLSVPKSRIKRTARVGIARGREHQWRFYDSASSFVSAHPKY